MTDKILKFSNRALAVVFASWYLVGTAIAYLVKWSVITKTFSKHPFDFSKVRKSIHSISKGFVLLIFTRLALGFSAVFLRIHLPQVTNVLLFLWSLSLFYCKKNLCLANHNVLSLPWWPASLWIPWKAKSLYCNGNTICIMFLPSKSV